MEFNLNKHKWGLKSGVAEVKGLRHSFIYEEDAAQKPTVQQRLQRTAGIITDSQVIYSAGGDCSDAPDNVCKRNDPYRRRIITIYTSQGENTQRAILFPL